MDFVDCCWHVVTTSQVAKSVLADVTFHWEWKCTKHYRQHELAFCYVVKIFLIIILCRPLLHYDDGFSFIYLCRLHWMILLSLSSRTQSYLPSDLALANAGYFKAKVATKLYDLTYTELKKYANCLRWQTTPSSCVKLSSMEGATSPTWRSVSLTSLTTCKTSSTKTQRFESELWTKSDHWEMSIDEVYKVCENNLEFTNTPHTPMKRDGVLFITQRRQVRFVLQNRNSNIFSHMLLQIMPGNKWPSREPSGNSSWEPCGDDLPNCGR